MSGCQRTTTGERLWALWAILAPCSTTREPGRRGREFSYRSDKRLQRRASDRSDTNFSSIFKGEISHHLLFCAKPSVLLTRPLRFRQLNHWSAKWNVSSTTQASDLWCLAPLGSSHSRSRRSESMGSCPS